MKEINCKHITQSKNEIPVERAAQLLDDWEKHPLEFAPWKNFPYKPKVSFAMGYTAHAIMIKFFVEEKELRANATRVHEPVWEDSCVEFFAGFEKDTDAYYNFEFNCLGTCHAAYGNSRNDRKLLPVELVQNIKSYSEIRKNEENNVCWELTVSIPVSSFIHSKLTGLQGTSCRANFYKCGDLLKEPHFISWSNIEAPSPDFHLPTFFGKLNFVKDTTVKDQSLWQKRKCTGTGWLL